MRASVDTLQRDDLGGTSAKVTLADLYRAAWASSLGSALEYYDFALYSLASALIFGPLFFPSSNPNVGLLASFDRIAADLPNCGILGACASDWFASIARSWRWC